jgi:ribonuclease G
VGLASGGDIVIEPTEALVSIDVNTGRAQGRDLSGTVLQTNLEAAREIPRQLRLRGLGGIVVIDFVDMTSADHRQRVLQCLEAALRGDPARSRVVGWSALGLVELTRKRSGSAISDRIGRDCPHCAGRGRIRTVGPRGDDERGP